MGKKKILIIAGASCLVIVLCCVAGFLGGSVVMNKITAHGFEAKDEVVLTICKNKDDFDNTMYKKYFTEDFRSKMDFQETEDLVDEVFPSDFSCEDLETSGIIQLLKSSQSISVNVVNGFETITFEYNTSSERISMTIVSDGDEGYQIDDIATAHK